LHVLSRFLRANGEIPVQGRKKRALKKIRMSKT